VKPPPTAATTLFDPLAKSHLPHPSVSSSFRERVSAGAKPRSKRVPGNPRVAGSIEGTPPGSPCRDGNQSDTRHGNAMGQHP
jgi:hypothetical protein